MRSGDLIATSTLSGLTGEELRCLLEITRNGEKVFEMTARVLPNETLVRPDVLAGRRHRRILCTDRASGWLHHSIWDVCEDHPAFKMVCVPKTVYMCLNNP
jgi:hypothetical protein